MRGSRTLFTSNPLFKQISAFNKVGANQEEIVGCVYEFCSKADVDPTEKMVINTLATTVHNTAVRNSCLYGVATAVACCGYMITNVPLFAIADIMVGTWCGITTFDHIYDSIASKGLVNATKRGAPTKDKH